MRRSTVPSKVPSQGVEMSVAAAGAAAQAPQRPLGPTVRIARGNNVTIVPVGAK